MLLFSLPCAAIMAQKPLFQVHHLSLPLELEYFDNQFSGLYIHNGKLFLLSECRLQEGAESKLYAINLFDLDRKIKDTSLVLPFEKYCIENLDVLRGKIEAAGQCYEGLEAILIDTDKVYISVETDTPSSTCYLLTGQIYDSTIVLNTDFLIPLNKPLTEDSTHIYNAGFEAVAQKENQIFAFYEFNNFNSQNNVYQFNKQTLSNKSLPEKKAIERIPFRITDITHVNKDHFTAINYFFKGGGGDTVYRTPTADKQNDQLIRNKAGYKNYCRLIDIQLQDSCFKWKPIWDFPEQCLGYNWEGIAAYKNGYFIVNDKYTAQRPYRSALLYLEEIK
jgi:hypothetical protein